MTMQALIAAPSGGTIKVQCIDSTSIGRILQPVIVATQEGSVSAAVTQ